MSYLRSGFYARPELPAPDTPVGAVLAERRLSLISDLGGIEACSTAQLCLVDLVVASWATLDSVTGYLLTLPSLVDRRHRRVWQVVRDRDALAGRLQSLLRDLGLERRARDVRTDVVAMLAEAAKQPVGGLRMRPRRTSDPPGGPASPDKCSGETVPAPEE